MGIKSFFSIIGKNMKLLFRSKYSTLTIILFPLLVILLVGFAFNSSGINGISVGFYSNSQSTLSTEILNDFNTQGYFTEKFDSRETCIEQIKLSDIQVCVLFPEDFSDLGSSENVEIYVDSSRMNLAYLILHEIESKVEYNSLEIGTSIADELLVSLSSLRNSLIKEKEELSELKDNSDKIDSIVTSIDEEPEIGTKLTKLKEVKNSLNSSTETSKINDAINLIEDYEEYSSSASSSFYQISVNNDKSLELLDTAIKRIDELVNSINSNKIENAEEIISPIKTNITSVNEDSNNLYNVLPTIISLIALFGGILLSASFILKERKTKAYFRNFMTPTINFTFLLANYFTCLFVLIFQFLLVFAGLYFIFGILVPIGNGEFFVSLLLSLSVFLLIGTFIGYLFKTEESIIFAAVLVASLMMFFSNTLLPIETFSSSLKTIAKFNPFVISDFMLRKLMIFNYGYKEILFEIYLLSGFATLFLVLSLLWRKFTKKIL